MPNVDPVILKLQADLKDYQRDLGAAQKLTDTKLDAIERRGMQMGQGLRKGFDLAKGAAIAFAGAVAVEKITQAITAGLEYASSLGEVAQQLGVTTDALQEYRYAASQAGLSQEEMDAALTQLTRRIGEAASGTKAQAEAFEKLGISTKDTSGNLLDAGTAIPLIADALQRIESPAERAAILMDLFGKSGQKLEPLLAGGAAGVNNLRDAAHKLGIVLSSEQIQKADDAADKLAALKQVLEARVAGVVSDNADSILLLANSLATLVDKAGAAVRAWQQWRKEVANRQDQSAVDGWFTSDADRKAAQARIDARNSTSRVVMGGGGRVAPAANAKRPKSGFGAPLSLDAGKIGPNWGSAKWSPLPKSGNFAGNGGEGFVGGGVKGGLEAIGGGAAMVAIARYTGELERLSIDLAMAQADLTGNIQARAEAEKRRIDLDAATEIDRLKASDELKGAELDKAIAVRQQIASAQKELADQRVKEELAARELETREESYRLELDALDAERDAATHLGERRDIERRILELQQQEETARLEAAIAAGQIADAAQARAQLARKQSAERTGLANDQKGPGAVYLDSLKKDAAELNEAYQNVAVDGLRSLNDGLVEAIMGSKSLGDVFKNVANQIIADLLRIAIQQAIIQPLASGLFSAGGIFGSLGGSGGSGGGIGGGIGGWSSFGRASGGYVAPGQFYRVNEAASPGRVEGFMSRDGGRIVPLGQMNALQQGGAGQGGGTATVRLELSGDIDARIQRVSGPVAIEVVRASAPTIIDASARETMARAGRPRL